MSDESNGIACNGGEMVGIDGIGAGKQSVDVLVPRGRGILQKQQVIVAESLLKDGKGRIHVNE